MKGLNVFVGQDLQGDACLYVQIIGADGDPVRFLNGAELEEIAEMIYGFRNFTFDQADEAEVTEDDNAGEN